MRYKLPDLVKAHGWFAATLFGAAMLVLLSAWPAYLLHREAGREASQAAEYYGNNAKHDIALKCRDPMKANLECTKEIEGAARENQRKEFDLAAQKQMTIWAALMGWMAVLGVAFSAIVAFLVWTTFRETKRTADEAK